MIARRPGEPVDAASLVLFRVAFGLTLLWDIVRHFRGGWIRFYYIQPVFHFQYPGFGWVEPLPGPAMYALFVLLGLAAAGIAVGFLYRACCVFFGLGFGYVFLLEELRYLNHYYLIVLLCFLMAVIPAHRLLSVDARLRPGLRSSTVPAWSLWLLRLQIGIVYFYAGLAKLKWDWLQGRPTVYMWAKASLRHEWMQAFDLETMAYFLSYGGLLLDLFVVPLLLWRRTRGFAFAAAIFFHVSNKLMFAIGIFPYLMTAATTLFFEPDWPRRFVNRFRREAYRGGRKRGGPAGTAPPSAVPERKETERVPKVLIGALAIYAVIQLTVPLRHYLYPGSVLWTEEGQYFAWHMILRSKDVKEATFLLVDPATGEPESFDPARLLPRWQVEAMGRRPDLIHQFALHLRDELEAIGLKGYEVRARVRVSLNGRAAEWMIDPEVDLARERRSLWPKGWILPQKEPLPPMEEVIAEIRRHVPGVGAD